MNDPAPAAVAEAVRPIALIDVPIERLFRMRAFLPFVLVGLAAAAMVGLTIGLLRFAGVTIGMPGRYLPYLAGILVGLLVIPFFQWAIRRRKRRISEMVAAFPQSEIRTHIDSILARENGVWVPQALQQLLLELARRPFRPSIIRLWPGERLTPVTPLDIAIEPITLDESDAAFDELSEALGDTQQRSTQNRYDATARRRLRRNLALSGGWLVIGIFAFNTLVAVLRALGERAMNEGLVIWPLFLLLMLGGKRQARGLRGACHWLLVSGGLLQQRTGGWRKPPSTHLFTAPRSLLCVYRLQGKQWGFIVADVEGCEVGIATKRELDMLLRAWLSPHPPPTNEQVQALFVG